MKKQVYQWLNEQENRKTILKSFNQPLISRQISKKTGIPANTCSYVIATFVDKGLLICLNSKSNSSRLFWLTDEGLQLRKKLFQNHNLSYKQPVLSNIDWSLYGWTCFAHRSSVIKILTYPMQPSEIKRLFRLQGTHIRISSNNIRDIVKLFLAKGIVRPVKVRKKAHLRYELTDLGIKLRDLLIKANAPA